MVSQKNKVQQIKESGKFPYFNRIVEEPKAPHLSLMEEHGFEAGLEKFARLLRNPAGSIEWRLAGRPDLPTAMNPHPLVRMGADDRFNEAVDALRITR